MTGLLKGALAGAAGTTALNATTYLDMALRGRGTSDSPEQVVEQGLHAAGLDVPGSGDTRDNRLAGLGPLSGTAVGVAVGAGFGAVHRALAKRGRALPPAIEIAMITGAAMALTDTPLKLLGISDPAAWSTTDWIGDLVPHLVFGVVTYVAIKATEEPAA